MCGVLGKIPLIAVSTVAQLILGVAPAQHSTFIYHQTSHSLRLSVFFPTAGVAVVPHGVRPVLVTDLVFVSGSEQSFNNIMRRTSARDIATLFLPFSSCRFDVSVQVVLLQVLLKSHI